jgi:D-galactarolactone cycloisomerase
LKITAVKTFPLRYKLSRRLLPSPGFITQRTSLIIKLETDAGICGWGETGLFPGLPSLIAEQYAPLLIGRDPVAHRPLWRQLWGPNFGSGTALGGVDIALEDLRGKALGLPVAELYGGRLRDEVDIYASTLGFLEGEDAKIYYPRLAEQYAAAGFRAIKLKIGAQTIKEDVAAVAAARKAVGPGMKIMADGNGAYSLGEAIRVGRELEQLGLYWYEEPLPMESTEYAAYEELAATLDIPIAAGEVLASRGLFKELITRRAIDIVQPDACLAGGIGECLFIAEMARLWGMTCMPHACVGGVLIAMSVHLVSLLPDASWARTTEPPMVEVDMTENPFRDEVLVTPLKIVDGRIAVPTAPGLGVEVDEEKLAFYADRR